MRRTLLAWAPSLALLIGACGPAAGGAQDASINSACTHEIRAETYLPGMKHACVNGKFTVELVTSTPGPPEKGDNTWLVQVSDEQGQPLEGATLSVVPYMPDHGHGTAIKVLVSELGSGQYQLKPLDLFMAGLWRVTVNVTKGTTNDFSQFYFCIDG